MCKPASFSALHHLARSLIAPPQIWLPPSWPQQQTPVVQNTLKQVSSSLLIGVNTCFSPPGLSVAVVVSLSTAAGLSHSSSDSAPSVSLSFLPSLLQRPSLSPCPWQPLCHLPSLWLHYLPRKQLLMHTSVAFDIIWISHIFGSTASWGFKSWTPFSWDKTSAWKGFILRSTEKRLDKI